VVAVKKVCDRPGALAAALLRVLVNRDDRGVE
jgi:hypothetical protein